MAASDDMADNQSANHGSDSVKSPRKRAQKNKQITIVTVTVIVVAVVLWFAAFYVIFLRPEPQEDSRVLYTETPLVEINPGDLIEFDITIRNLEERNANFILSVAGLPPEWFTSLPDSIFLEVDESYSEVFSIWPHTANILSGTYDFWLNVTSTFTGDEHSLSYTLVVNRIFGMSMMCYNTTHTAEAGRSTSFALVINNTGNGMEMVSLTHSQLPPNWSIVYENNPVEIPSYSVEVVIINITTNQIRYDELQDMDITARATNGHEETLTLTILVLTDLGDRTVEIGDKVQVDWIGFYPNGSIFGTSLDEVAENDDFPKGEQFSHRPSYEPFKMIVGGIDPDGNDEYSQAIEGFWMGVVGMKVNETVVVRLPPDEAYNDGRIRLFEITMVSFDS